MRGATKWLNELPWWQFAPTFFILMALIFTLADYISAWLTGGVSGADVGFTSAGDLSLRSVASAAAIVTTMMVLARAWRCQRMRRDSARPRPSRRADRPL